MIPVQDIIDRVTDLLLDKDRDDDEARWLDTELLRWLNDSRMAIVTRRPQAYSRVSTVELVTGTYQTIPEDGIQLLDVIRNMGMTGLVPGRSIRRTDRQNIDDTDMYWHRATNKIEISQFTFDDRVPRSYYVTPPALAGTQVQIAYTAVPEAVTALTDNLNFGMEYMDAAVNYVCYRAKSKDSEYANASEASAYYAAFNDALGSQAQAESTASPNQPGNSV